MNELASRLRALPSSDLSLAVGAAALASGAVLAYGRMVNSWADFPLFLLIAVPCAVLFALALAPGSGGNAIGTGADGRLAPWQTACVLAGIPLLALSILLLIKALGKDDPGTGTATWVLALTGLFAAFISVRLDSPGATVLAALSLSAGALTAINWIDSEAELAAYRDVLLVEGIIFLLLARAMWDSRHVHAKQLVAVAGIGLIGGAAVGNGPGSIPSLFLSAEAEAGAEDGWTFIMIAVSLGILAFAAWQRHGGSAFVGLAGLYGFFVFTGNGDLSGWPLLLGLTALACIVWALAVRPSRQAPTAGPTSAQPPAPPQPPPT